MQGPRIVVVGSLNADLVVRTARFPQPGETLTGSELAVIPGGKGANQAVAAGRLGGDVTMVGAVGDDANGSMLLESLSDAGVDVTRIARRDDTATGTAVITVDDAGENTIIVSPGANGTLAPERIGEAWSALDGAGVVCLCLEVPLETVLEAAQRGAAAGAVVLLNLSPFGPVPEELLQATGVLLVNEHEAAELTGIDPEASGWAAMASALRDRGVRRAVVTTGAAGSVVIDEGADAVVVRSPKVTAVDTTGCGDAFMGALARRLAAGDTLVDAARFASAVGSFAATGAGAQASYPSEEQLGVFREEHPVASD